MDREYIEIGGSKGPVYDDFVPALAVLATVISVPSADRVVLDAGMKSLSTDAGPAAAIGVPGWEYGSPTATSTACWRALSPNRSRD
jgi:D-serine deaminase-like pyridoxal phosphate-dependent protein